MYLIKPKWIISLISVLMLLIDLSELIELKTVYAVTLTIIFHPTTPCLTDETSQSSGYTVSISVENVLMNLHSIFPSFQAFLFKTRHSMYIESSTVPSAQNVNSKFHSDSLLLKCCRFSHHYNLNLFTSRFNCYLSYTPL